MTTFALLIRHQFDQSFVDGQFTEKEKALIVVSSIFVMLVMHYQHIHCNNLIIVIK